MIMDHTTPRYNLGYVIRETNIHPDTLRAWERRYGVPTPQRSEGGHRLYTERDIETIRWLIHQQNEGLSISKAVDLFNDLIAEGQDPLSAPPVITKATSLNAPDTDHLRAKWIVAVSSFDNARSEQVLSQAFANYPIKTVLSEVLQQGLIEIGDQWYRGDLTVQQEHFASALVARRLHALIAAAPAPIQPGCILVALPAGEQHEVAPLMLTLLLRYAGWDVIYLSANVPITQLGMTLEQTKPELVILSAQRLPTAASLLDTALFVSEHNISLAFGGAVFNRIPELRERIPGHFIGETIEDAIHTIDTILLNSLPTPIIKTIPTAYHNLLESFRKALPQIEMLMNQKVLGSSITPTVLANYNRQLAEYISSALTLGDMRYAEQDIEWIYHLIGHHNIDPNTLPLYLQIYRDTLSDTLGGQGNLITNWLDMEIIKLAQKS